MSGPPPRTVTDELIENALIYEANFTDEQKNLPLPPGTKLLAARNYRLSYPYICCLLYIHVFVSVSVSLFNLFLFYLQEKASQSWPVWMPGIIRYNSFLYLFIYPLLYLFVNSYRKFNLFLNHLRILYHVFNFHRLSPYALLGLKEGDAHVIRNAGINIFNDACLYAHIYVCLYIYIYVYLYT